MTRTNLQVYTMTHFLATPLGVQSKKSPHEFHTCDSCVNKAALVGANYVIGGATRVAATHQETYAAFEQEVIAGWKAASRRYFAANSFQEGADDESMFMSANLMALNALLIQFADIACNGMSPIDRVGFMSGVSRAFELLTIGGTYGLHNERYGAGTYTDAKAAQVVDGVLEDPIPKDVLAQIADAWSDWSPGAEHPVPSDFAEALGGSEDVVQGSDDANLRDVAKTLLTTAIGGASDPETDLQGAMDHAAKLYELGKQLFPVGNPKRTEMDRMFGELKQAYDAKVASKPRGSYEPVDIGDDAQCGFVALEFDHKPTTAEIAQGVYEQIKRAHPQAKITVEQIEGALAGKQVPGVRAIGIGG